MIRPFKRWNGFCYLGAAGVGLALDIALYCVALAHMMLPVLAAAFAYAAGAVVTGWLCQHGVFAHQTATVSQLRDRQKAMFVKASAIGLIVTSATIMLGLGIGMGPLAAKALAIVLSFYASLLPRRQMLLID